MATEQLLSVEALTKAYKDKPILNHLSFEINSGEVIGLIGNNGAGKTTLMNMISGMISVTSGSITYKGRKLNKENPYFRKDMGILPSFDILIDELSVSEYLRFATKYHGSRVKGEIIEELKHLLEIESLLDSKIRTLSKGQRVKVSLIVAFMHQPSFFLLDEPFANLDVKSRHKVLGLIQSLSHQDKAFLVSSHEIELLAPHCTRFLVISEGEIAMDVRSSDFESTAELVSKVNQQLIE